MSRVDVVIPCYKYGQYLRQCVESVLSQEGVEVRVLILDDASPDDTPEVAAALVREDNRVEYRRHAVNRGHIDTYNEGVLEWASGDYVLLISADDLLAAGALGRAAKVMDAHPEVGLVHGRQQLFANDPSIDESPDGDGVSIISGQEFVEECCAVAHNPVATPTAVVRTSVQHAVGGYRKSLPHTADMELWLRFGARSAVTKVDALQAFKRVHTSNMQHQYLETALGDLKERHETFEAFFREDGRRMADHPRLHSLALRQLGESAFWAASVAFENSDEAGCQQCLDLARLWCPDLIDGKAWASLRWKRRIGPRLWNLLRYIVDPLRSRNTALAS
jgi:glycosyltransferase involved in cell wall biosynthesis